jgi:hypothetical protein
MGGKLFSSALNIQVTAVDEHKQNEISNMSSYKGGSFPRTHKAQAGDENAINPYWTAATGNPNDGS